jgi:hypothetical protein
VTAPDPAENRSATVSAVGCDAMRGASGDPRPSVMAAARTVAKNATAFLQAWRVSGRRGRFAKGCLKASWGKPKGGVSFAAREARSAQRRRRRHRRVGLACRPRGAVGVHETAAPRTALRLQINWCHVCNGSIAAISLRLRRARHATDLQRSNVAFRSDGPASRLEKPRRQLCP